MRVTLNGPRPAEVRVQGRGQETELALQTGRRVAAVHQQHTDAGLDLDGQGAAVVGGKQVLVIDQGGLQCIAACGLESMGENQFLPPAGGDLERFGADDLAVDGDLHGSLAAALFAVIGHHHAQTCRPPGRDQRAIHAQLDNGEVVVEGGWLGGKDNDLRALPGAEGGVPGSGAGAPAIHPSAPCLPRASHRCGHR